MSGNAYQSNPSWEALRAENEELRARLDEAEQTIGAIRQGTVDALIVAGPDGDKVFTLAGAELNYRLLIESIDEGALTATHDGTILYCNSKFAQMVNEPVERIVGHRISEFVSEEERANFEKFLHVGLTHANRQEVTLHSRGGKPIATKFSLGLLDAEGISGISLIVTDLTETKMAAALLTANAELNRSNADLARFAFIASHDLKEPLRVISSYVQMLELRLKDQFDDVTISHMHYIVDAVARLYALINDLLSYSRIGADPAPPTEVDCNQMIREAISNVDASLKECDGEIQCAPLPTVVGNRGELIQLFQNLLGNAIKYRGGVEPRIDIGSRKEPERWVFWVRDNGIGIEPRYFDKIFILFQRLHGKQSYSGTGIGLAICKKVVERHGGEIWVESAPDRGSTFYFSIPDKTQRAGIGEHS